MASAEKMEREQRIAVALVTGASSGIGKHTALELARRGHRVYASMRNPGAAKYILSDAAKEKLALEIVRLDVTEPESVAAAFEEIIRREGRIDVLVNNAGFGSIGPVEAYGDDDIRHVFETNFLGAVRTARAAIPAMRAQGSGMIVMVSSISGLRTFSFLAIYSASKFALEAVSNGLRMELKPFGIRVVLVEPGNFRTRAGANMHFPARLRSAAGIGELPYADQIRKGRGREPKLGDPRDVARAIADAVQTKRPRARYIVGKDAEMLLIKPADDLQRLLLETRERREGKKRKR